MTIQEILEAHQPRILNFACACGVEFNPPNPQGRPALRHRAHVAEVLDKHMQEREVALLSEVAEEAIDKYADKPYSPGHVIRLLLTRANHIRKEQS